MNSRIILNSVVSSLVTLSPLTAQTTLYLVRHGETQWNVERKAQGHTNTPLNEKGIQQANQLAEKFYHAGISFDICYSSDLQRAFHTAEIIAKKLDKPVIPSVDLREIYLGEAEGLTFEERESRWKEKREELDAKYPHRKDRWDHSEVPGRETNNHALARVKAVITKIAHEHPGGNILIVGHHGIISNLLIDATDTSQRVIPNCATVVFEYQENDSDKPFKFVRIEGLDL